ncbi:hypothetical protein [Pelagerythrobacter aerophilus]
MAKISASSNATLNSEKMEKMLRGGATRRGALAGIIGATAAPYVAAAQILGEQAPEMIKVKRIFVDLSLAEAEAATTEGNFFKLVDSASGTATVFRRTATGSAELYSEITAGILIDPEKGPNSLRVRREGGAARERELREWLGEQAVSITDFENVYPDGSGDSSYATEAALSKLQSKGGGVLLCPGKFLIGEQEIAQSNVVIMGRAPDDEIIVKSGTLGLHVKKDWVHFRNITLRAEGNRDDGLNTRGVLYSQGPGNSTGHILNSGIRIEGFSGFGMEVRNTLHLQIIGMFIRNCMIGFRWRREGTGAADFSTTSNLIMCYGISCDVAYDLERVRHSQLTHMICEWNRIGIKANLCNFELAHGYFENNTARGVDCIDSSIADKDCYHNGPLDALVRTWTPGVISAAERYYRSLSKGDSIAKRHGVLSQFGVDPCFIEAHGTTSNIGLRYGTATLAMKRGPNLLKPAAWEGEGSGNGNGSELVGWVPEKGGYEISGSKTRARGMRQTINVSAGQTYVMDWKATNVLGAPLNTARVGADTVTNGVPFTASADGPVVVKLFGVQASRHENIVTSISLASVDTADPMLIADIQDRLSRLLPDRGAAPVSAPPATTAGFARGELLPNANKALLGPPGSQYVLEGWWAIDGQWIEKRSPTGS